MIYVIPLSPVVGQPSAAHQFAASPFQNLVQVPIHILRQRLGVGVAQDLPGPGAGPLHDGGCIGATGTDGGDP